MSLVLGGLPAGVTLLTASGVTQTQLPPGSVSIALTRQRILRPGQRLTVVLFFDRGPCSSATRRACWQVHEPFELTSIPADSRRPWSPSHHQSRAGGRA